jgi:hypothetical protein
MNKHPVIIVSTILFIAAFILSACSSIQIIPGASNLPTDSAKGANASASGSEDNQPASIPVLSCEFSTDGSMMIDEKPIHFTCGKLDNLDVVLFGEMSTTDKGWQIARANLVKTEDGFSVESKGTAIVSAVILSDGTRCEAADAAKAITIGDQKVNFTCGSQNDRGIVLLGGVTAGDTWQAAKAGIVKGDSGFASDSIEPIVIDRIEVQ